MKLIFSTDNESYVSEYLMAVKSTNDKYDILTNKNSKLCYYYFNNFLDRQARQTKGGRPRIIPEDEHGLLELKSKNWSCSLEQILDISENENLERDDWDESDSENKLIMGITRNLYVCL